jgi:apolipoprotein N-acyltransferase
VPLVRAANTGISAIIDPWGRVLSRLDVNVVGVLDSALPAALDTAPPYAAVGELWLAPLVLGLFVAGLWRWRKQRLATLAAGMAIAS